MLWGCLGGLVATSAPVIFKGHCHLAGKGVSSFSFHVCPSWSCAFYTSSTTQTWTISHSRYGPQKEESLFSQGYMHIHAPKRTSKQPLKVKLWANPSTRHEPKQPASLSGSLLLSPDHQSWLILVLCFLHFPPPSKRALQQAGHFAKHRGPKLTHLSTTIYQPWHCSHHCSS